MAHLNTFSANLFTHSVILFTRSDDLFSCSDNLFRHLAHLYTRSAFLFTCSDNLYGRSENLFTLLANLYARSDNLFTCSVVLFTRLAFLLEPSGATITHPACAFLFPVVSSENLVPWLLRPAFGSTPSAANSALAKHPGSFRALNPLPLNRSATENTLSNASDKLDSGPTSAFSTKNLFTSCRFYTFVPL